MLVEHHLKYKEINGIDETIWIESGEHHKIDHRSLFPNINKENLHEISNAAHKRTHKYIKNQKEYKNKYIETIRFDTSYGKNTRLRETISYNNKIGNVSYSSNFDGIHNHKLFVINIGD